jgi:hypothetical protein
MQARHGEKPAVTIDFDWALPPSVWRQGALRQDMNTGTARADFCVAAEPADNFSCA